MSWTLIYIIAVALFCFLTHMWSWDQGYDAGWDAAFDKVLEIMTERIERIEEIENRHSD